jgi:hypothetical protein
MIKLTTSQLYELRGSINSEPSAIQAEIYDPATLGRPGRVIAHSRDQRGRRYELVIYQLRDPNEADLATSLLGLSTLEKLRARQEQDEPDWCDGEIEFRNAEAVEAEVVMEFKFKAEFFGGVFGNLDGSDDTRDSFSGTVIGASTSTAKTADGMEYTPVLIVIDDQTGTVVTVPLMGHWAWTVRRV